MEDTKDICINMQKEQWYNLSYQIDDLITPPFVEINKNGDPINDIREQYKLTIDKLVRTTIPINILDQRKVNKSNKQKIIAILR